MEEIRNIANKLVCRIDKKNREVEIVMKGARTLIRFEEDGTVKVKNTQAA